MEKKEAFRCMATILLLGLLRKNGNNQVPSYCMA